MTAYRIQQLMIQAAIDAGDFEKASDLARLDISEFSKPSHDPPTESGDNQTLTDSSERDIMYTIGGMISRAVKRRKRTMTIHGRAITNEDMQNIAGYMIDEIREELHGKLAPCSNEKFLREYIKRDPEILEILRNEFDFSE